MSHVKGPTGKPVKETVDQKPGFKRTQAFGPGVGKGGDQMTSDKPVKGPRN